MWGWTDEERAREGSTGLHQCSVFGFTARGPIGGVLGVADIHILPQRAETADLVLPSKLSGMFASGQPIIAMAEPGAGLVNEVGAADVVIKPGDAQAMAEAISTLAENPSLRETMGAVAQVIANR